MDYNSQQNEINNIISQSWDANVELRAKELCKSNDFSYQNIIVPWVIENIKGTVHCDANILDIGCGCGYLTNIIFSHGCKNIIGIDISKESIKIAKNLYPHINFLKRNIFSFTFHKEFQLCISVMTVNNLPDIDRFFNKISELLSIGGRAVLILPHPWFWPTKHLENHSFSYLQEKTYSYKFSTKTQKGYPSTVLYFHRSLERYCSCILSNGFIIEKISELPEATCYENPDIIGIVIKKV